MSTFLQRLQSAMQMTGAVASGETPTTDEQTDGLAAANQMLDDWCAERRMIYAEKRTTHTMIAGTNPHTIGSSGNFNTDRPVKIDRAGAIVAGDTFEVPVYVARSMDEYAAITNKSTTASLPTFLYYAPAFPLGNIYLNPVPDAANTLILYRWTPLTSIATAGTTVALPPGYESAFDYNLALRLAARNIGVASGIVIAQARESLERLVSLNLEIPILSNDAAGLGEVRGGGRTWNVLTDIY